MFQASDGAVAARQEWMRVLALAPLAQLESWAQRLAEAGALPETAWLRKPETGLVMLRGRAGGSGEQFNVGEMTLTRCALRIATGEVGIAYVKGRSQRKAELVALADALLQSPASREGVVARLIEPLRAAFAAQAAQARAKAQATKVEFFTLAREAGA